MSGEALTQKRMKEDVGTKGMETLRKRQRAPSAALRSADTMAAAAVVQAKHIP